MIYKFYDTCSLLLKGEHLFDIPDEKVVISSISLQELEEIKSFSRKDTETKVAARALLRFLDKNVGKYEVHIYRESMINKLLEKCDLPISNDIKILATAFDYDYFVHPDETIFVTNDLALKTIANLFFGEDSIESVDEDLVD